MIQALALKAGAWLLGRPSVIVGLVAAVGIAGTVGVYQVKLWSARSDLADARTELASEKMLSATLTVQLGETRANIDKLAGEIRDQNDAIKNIAAAADAAGKAAALTAVRSLQQADTAKRRSDALAGSGPGVMNQWLTDAFPPR